jgi:hypothetical protein
LVKEFGIHLIHELGKKTTIQLDNRLLPKGWGLLGDGENKKKGREGKITVE